MRLSRLDLTRYGRFTGFSLDFGKRREGRPDLHIVYGPNEAGKSTAFAGFLDLLFGIEPRSRFDFLHPYATMQVGARLEWDAHAHDLIRVKRNANSLLGANGQPVPETLLRGALNGIDRDGYRTMFSLDDDSLEKGGDSILESRGDLGQLLFSASAGLADLGQTLESLQAEAETFHKFRAHKTGLTGLKATLAELRERRESTDTLASAYAQMVGERDASLKAYRDAAAGLAATRARIERINHLVAAHGPWLRLQALDGEAAPLAALPEPPGHWADDLATLQREAIELETRRSTSAALLDRLDREIAAMPLDALALGLSARFKQLGEAAGRHLKAEQDLPAERLGVAETGRGIAAILQRIERADTDPALLPIPAALTARLRELIEEGITVAAAAEAARGEARTASERLTEAEARPGGAPDDRRTAAATLDPLKAALSAWRGSDAPARRRVALQARDAQAELLHERLLQLAPWQGEAEALASLVPPSSSRLEAWKAASREKQNRLAEASAEAKRLERERGRLRAALQAGRDAGLVDGLQAEAARLRRDEAWAAHRAALDSGSAERFEEALRRDDGVAAARLLQSHDAARHKETSHALAVAESELEGAEARERLASDALAALQTEIADALQAAVPGLPADWPIEDWQAWSVRRERALEAWSGWRAAERACRDAEKETAGLAERLDAALGEAGVACDGVEAAVAADAMLGREAELRAARAEADARRREAGLRRARCAEAEQRQAAWNAAWRAACAATWIGGDAAPGAVRAVLDALGELAPLLEKRTATAARIAAMEADRAVFTREVKTLSLLLGLSRDEANPIAAFEGLGARIRTAETVEDRRAAKVGEREAAAGEDAALAGRIALHERRAAAMTGFFDAGSLAETARLMGEVARRRTLRAERDAALHQLRQALGGLDAAAHEAELAALDPAGLKGELAELAARLETEEARARDLYALHTKAADKVEGVGGDDAVARIEESRRTVLLDIEERALGYLRLRVGIAAAEAGLRAYRDRHRSTMMDRASDAFRTVSRGAYSRLATQPGRDGDVLVGVAADGASKLSVDMSKGTRFQLYLALRVAGYFEFAATRAPVPFVADDIMETFDDFRAEEAFRLFAEMAEVGQVIYLTHHRHLVDIARDVCPGVQVHGLAEPAV